MELYKDVNDQSSTSVLLEENGLMSHVINRSSELKLYLNYNAVL